MLWISHRGNVNGPQPTDENKIDYIFNALYEGYEVEVDIWYIDDILYLGHDEPNEKLPDKLLYNNRIWFHCKNIEALQYMSLSRFNARYNSPKYFWHQTDDYTLTSHGHIWTYPGKRLVAGSIAVVPELGYEGNLADCYAICTDYITRFEQEVMHA